MILYLLLLKVITEEVYKMLETETHLKKTIIPVRLAPLHPGHPIPATYSYFIEKAEGKRANLFLLYE